MDRTINKKNENKWPMIVLVLVLVLGVGYVSSRAVSNYKFANPNDKVTSLIENFYSVSPAIISIGEQYDVKPMAVYERGGSIRIYLVAVKKSFDVLYEGGSATLLRGENFDYYDSCPFIVDRDYFADVLDWYIPLSVSFDINGYNVEDYKITVKIQYHISNYFLYENDRYCEELHEIIIHPSDLHENLFSSIEDVCTKHDMYNEDLEYFLMNINMGALEDLKKTDFVKWKSFIDVCINSYSSGESFYSYFLDKYGKAVFSVPVPEDESEYEIFIEMKQWMEGNVHSFSK